MRIGIIGSGKEHAIILAHMKAQLGHEVDLVLVEPKDIRTIGMPDPKDVEPILFTSTPPVKGIYREEYMKLGKKEVVCKGKHRYERVETKSDGLVKVDWVCQCGRNMYD